MCRTARLNGDRVCSFESSCRQECDMCKECVEEMLEFSESIESQNVPGFVLQEVRCQTAISADSLLKYTCCQFHNYLFP